MVRYQLPVQLDNGLNSTKVEGRPPRWYDPGRMRFRQVASAATVSLCAFAAGTSTAAGQEVHSAHNSDITVRATRLGTSLRVDGRLDERVYSSVEPTSGFLQQEPNEGAPATEPTDIWIFFDDENLYVAARCWDSQPERQVYTELRRDARNLSRNDNLVVVFDTFLDRRNGFYFQTSPSGAIRDQAITEEKSNSDWNTVWEVKVYRSDKGWQLEMEIPFKSLRYRGAGPQTWGINFRRTVKWKNEVTYLTPMTVAYSSQGILKMAENATLVGLETPADSRNLELTPYAVGDVSTDRSGVFPAGARSDASGGFDFKYGLTRSLIADVTVNTDFAQVEEDVQQVNLTRFSLFFPEKRDFFLEGQGIFDFGNPRLTQGGGTPGDVPQPFFSRRIGISQGQAVPVIAGARVTGKVGKVSLGLLDIQTDDKPEAGALSTNFAVARAKVDVLRRSSIGILTTHRSQALINDGANSMVGVDTNLLFYQNININGYFATTSSRGVDDGHTSYQGNFEYAGDRYGLEAEHLNVGDGFNPEIGFVQRADFARSSLTARFSPRPRRAEVIRKLTYQAAMNYITSADWDVVQNRQVQGTFLIDFQNSDQLGFVYIYDYEVLPRPFAIANGVTVPAGGYSYDTARLSYTLGFQRTISGTLSAAAGSLYGGTRREASYIGRVAPIPMFAVEPGISLNWLDLPFGTFTATQLNGRFIITPSPSLSVSSLIQYTGRARALTSSVRLHWEYQSGSDIYVVFSDGRDTSEAGFPRLLNRAFFVKITRLFRF